MYTFPTRAARRSRAHAARGHGNFIVRGASDDRPPDRAQSGFEVLLLYQMGWISFENGRCSNGTGANYEEARLGVELDVDMVAPVFAWLPRMVMPAQSVRLPEGSPLRLQGCRRGACAEV